MLLRNCLVTLLLTHLIQNTNSSENDKSKCAPPMKLCDSQNGKTGLCYPPQWQCDGYADCADHSDEPDTCELSCDDSQFKCLTGKCLPPGFLCDGENDCGQLANGDDDLSDESPELCHHAIQCGINEYHCARTPECIALRKFCDGHVDCADGSDEHVACGETNGGEKCAYGAAHTIDGVQCYCPPNKVYRNGSCEYVDFCHLPIPVCSEKCENTGEGTFRCSCQDPRMKLINDSICVARLGARHPDIAVRSSSALFVLRENYTNILTNFPEGHYKSNAFGIVSELPEFENHSSPVMCYTDTSSANASLLICSTLDTMQPISKSFWLHINAHAVNILQYDAVGNNWVLSDGKHFITICRHEQVIRKCRAVGVGELGDIADFVYDPRAGFVFYVDRDVKSVGIWRIDVVNGTRKRLTKDTIVAATSLAIDEATRVVYFSDTALEHIRSIDYDASRAPRIVIGGYKAKMVRRMIYAEGRLIVLMSNGRVVMYNVLQGKDQHGEEINLPENGRTENAIDVMYMRGNRYKEAKKMCRKSDCEDICVGSRALCLCEDGTAQNGPKCGRVTEVKAGNLVVVAQMRPAAVSIMELEGDSTRDAGFPDIQHVGRPTALTVDTMNRRVIVYDQKRHSILVRRIGEQNETVFGFRGVWNCEGLAYDHTSDNLYLTDQDRKVVLVTKMSDLTLRKVIAKGNMTFPRAIVLHIPKSYVFWGSWSERGADGIPPKIERSKLDGSQRKTLVSRNALWINGMSIDVANDFLYWCDAFRNAIERIRINGADREIIIQGVDKVNHPYGLAFFNNDVYWSEFKNGNIKRFTPKSQKDPQIVHHLDTTLFELSVFSTVSPNLTSPCSANKCEQFCFASSCKGSVGCEPARCDCRDGMRLSGDGKCVEDESWIDPEKCDESVEFTCKLNGRCVLKTSICDGDDDCGDGSDEDADTTCKNFECAGQKHKCDGTTCLPLQWLCDGTRECDDGSDESSKICANQPKRCGAEMFQCSNSSTCLPVEKRCDGIVDCADRGDEKGCEIARFCDPTEFRCGNGRCIEQWQVCDGIRNCADGLDEAHCNEGCINGRQFRCRKGSECLDLIFRCDGVPDCDDESDESEEYCKNIQDDCEKMNQFKCADGKCIRRSHLCDGFADCLSAEDETDCPPELCNSTTHFVCQSGTKCVSKQLECDGVNDCGDNSDETHCDGVRRDAAELRCQKPMYRCQSETRFVCIAPEKLCDRVYDCPDRDDEGEWCEERCDPSEFACSHTCHFTIYGPYCVCPPHFTISGNSTCHKLDACRFGECSQRCQRFGSTKHCYCEDGFKLQSDRFTCISDDPNHPFLMYTNRHELRSIEATSGGASSPMIAKLANAIGLDYRYHRNGSISVYWTDLSADRIYGGLLVRKSIQFQRIVVSYGVFNAEGLAVDWVTGNIYWIDSFLDTIQVASEDGSRRATIVAEDMFNARALAIDSKHGLMFWTDWQESRPRIERATLAGTDRRMIWDVSRIEGAGWPNGITCDTLAERIYWVDAKSDSIHTITYDGADHMLVIRNSTLLGHPFGVDVFENFVYFSDWRSNTISRVDKWFGGNVSVVERVSTQPFTIRIVHRSKQDRKLKNPCESVEMKQCNGICVLSGAASATCHCTNLQNEGGGCDEMEQVLMIGTRNAIRALSLSPPNSYAFPLVSGKMFENIRNVEMFDKELRILDTSTSQLYAIDLKGSETERVLIGGSDALGISGMCMDRISGTTYLTFSNGRIEVMNRNGTCRRVLLDSTTFPEIRTPRDIVFLHQSRKVFWFDGAQIFTMYGDGLQPMGIATKGVESWVLGDAQHPAVDQEKQMVYWVSRGKLVSFDTITNQIQLLNIAGNVSGLAVDQRNRDLLVAQLMLPANRTTVRRFAGNAERLENIIMLPNIEDQQYFLSTALPESHKIADSCSTCDTICLRGINRTSCVCWQGAKMLDGTCRSVEKRLFYVTDDGALQSVGWFSRNGRTEQRQRVHTLHADISRQRIVRIAVDAKRDLIYAITRHNQVWMCATNGSFATRIFAATSHRIAALALDRVTGYVLISARFTSSAKGLIVLLDPSRHRQEIRTILVEDQSKVPYEIAVDPAKGKIFWASAECINAANYDGSNVSCIVRKSVATLAIDEKRSRLCYVDNEKTAVDCVDYSGAREQRGVLEFKAQGLGELVNFVINSDEMFLFDKFNMSGTIIRAARQPNNTFRPIESVMKSSPRMKLRLFDIDVMDVGNSVLYTACSNQNGGCDHLCVTIPSTKSAGVEKSCICVHSEMGNAGTCVPTRSFLAFTRFASIDFAPTDPQALSPPNRRITAVECFMAKAGPISADVPRGRLYFADYDKFRISAVNFDATGCFVVCEGIGIVSSLAYDEVHQDLYYIRSNPPGIWRISVAENDLEKYPAEPSMILSLTLRDRPRHIAVHPCRMLLYFSNNAVTGSVIERVYFSGYKREVVIEEDLNDVRGLAIDLDAEKLYFSDAIDFRVSRSDLDGTHRDVVITNSDSTSTHPFQLTIFNDELIFTDLIRMQIASINKHSGSLNRTIHTSTDAPIDLAIVDPNRQDCASNACVNNEPGCGDYCRLLSDGTPTCACNGERRLSGDNRTCTGDFGGKKCAENEFHCMASEMCIPYEETCDGYNDCPIHDDEDIKYCSTRVCRPGYFTCGNGLCIAESKKCNRINECFNFADETNCTCASDEFRCDSGICVPSTARCDFTQDCGDASDEKGCPFRNCSTLHEHGLVDLINCPTTTQCILPTWKCDGTNDCIDGWDEKDCFVDSDTPRSNPPKLCDNSTQFACSATRTCMPIHWRCDGQPDCADGSDERDCEKKCSARFEFTCADSGECIPIEQKCDGKTDCRNGEDEMDCEKNECENHGNTTFRCTNHRCIPMIWRCDGTDDCLDNAASTGSDEMNCGDAATSTRIPSRCANQSCEVACELSAVICDGIAECADGLDEQNCVDRDCAEGEWMCNNGQCISSGGLCNSAVDCNDGSDEWVDICSLSDPPKRGCPNGWACILKNGTFGCLTEDQLCDGRMDCMLGNDEHCSLPQGNCTLSVRNSCDQPWNCERRASFEKCSCDEGFHLSATDQSTCLRSPSCPRANCSHFCVDRRDVGHQCFCASGYILAENQRDCRRNDSIEAEIVLVIGHRVKLFSLDGHSKATLISNLTNGVAVDYDVKTDLVYWTDVTRYGNKAGVVSMNNQPRSYRVLHALPTKGVDGIAVDWLGRNIYYTDRHQDAIAVSDMRGRFSRILLKGSPLNDPRAIVLDPLRSLLFWTDWGTSAHIGRMRMDGSGVKVLLQDRTIRWPNALAVDAPAQRLYFGDAHRDYIGSCDYDGTRRRIVLRNVVRHIFAISVFEDYIYWSDWHNHTVERAHKITGENRKVLIHDQHYRPMGFKIVHPGMQSLGSLKTSKHPCSQPARCDNLCIPSQNAEGFTCMCAQGFRADGRSCVSECKPLDMVCSGTYKCIASWWRCDGQDDCGDGEDEGYFVDGVCPPFPCESGQFVCRRGATNSTLDHCLYSSKLCDGVRDCPLGDDEDPGFCEQFECGEGHFKCGDNRKCIALSAVCDKHDDCRDGSDERDCEIKDCGGGFFACINQTSSQILRCIPNEYYCDGEADCPQAQDEPNTCVISQCTPQQFRCSSGKCIPMSRKCDGEMDCRDGSDEKNCEDRCAWMCDSKCVSVESLCNGRYDCLNLGDESEEACIRKHLLNQTSSCPNPCADSSGCYSNRCDGIRDCLDGSDERDCNSPTCRLNGSIEKICDGILDCENGLDEMNCNRFGIACARQMIDDFRSCDGIVDCVDASDENSTECDAGKMKCGRLAKCDDRRGCFDASSGMCDGIRDCQDGSDEDPRHCNHMCVGKFRCTNGRCVDEGVRCDGRDDCGDWSDEETCGMECEHFGTCSQQCWSWNNSTQCHCSKGYTSNRNGGCVAISNFTEMVILNAKKIHWMMLPANSFATNLTPIKSVDIGMIPGAMGIKFESQKTKLLYTVNDEEKRTQIRSFMMLDALKSIQKRAVSQDRSTSAVLAYDYLFENVYFTESATKSKNLFESSGNIFVARQSDTSTRTLIINSTSEISSMDVAPEHNLLFWATRKPVCRIFAARLDGTTISTSATAHMILVESQLIDIRSLVADNPNKRLYWIDRFKRTVESVTFEGKDRRVIRKFALGNAPLTMDLLADELFVIVQSGHIHRMHKFSGHSLTFRQRIEHVSPLISIRLANAAKVASNPNAYAKTRPCSELARCPMENVCVPTKNAKGKWESKCLCGIGRFFEESTRKCEIVAEKDAEALQCGDYFCYNGATCNRSKQCVCRRGFVGRQCEIHECESECWNGAKCAWNGLKINCECAGNYTNTQCTTHVCDGLCGPRGTCRIINRPTTSVRIAALCECDEGWAGPECRHRLAWDQCSGYCYNGGSCSRKNRFELQCDCAKGYTGNRCQNCDSLECKNGGKCLNSKSGAICECLAGFSGPRCEIDACQDACPYAHKCTFNSSRTTPIQCECHPNAASRNTGCEPICEHELNWCRNGGKCVDYPGRPGVCKCPPRFGGPRCDRVVGCEEYCMNGARCLVRNETHYDCVCKKGFIGGRCAQFDACNDTPCENGGKCDANSNSCICPKGVGGSRCHQIVAKSCANLECANGGVCSTDVENVHQPPSCICPPGWGGLVCMVHTCDSYCHHGGSCEMVDREEPICRCAEGFGGARCEFRMRIEIPGGAKGAKIWKSLLTSILILLVIGVIFGLLVVFRSNRLTVFRQFRHVQMDDVAGTVDHFTNPAYLMDEGGGESTVGDNSSLVTNHERAAFNNPVYEHEMMPIYNDTVENSGLLRRSN